VGFLRKAALSNAYVIKPRLVGRSALIRAAPHLLPPRLFPGEPLSVMVELLKTDESSELELLGTLPDGSDFSLRVPLKAVPRAQSQSTLWKWRCMWRCLCLQAHHR
jgi:hypothetical protein